MVETPRGVSARNGPRVLTRQTTQEEIMDSIPYFVTRPVGEHMMPVYGFSRSYRHALVQHTDGAWYAHFVTINADGTATISTSGRWEYPKWIFEGDNRDAARYPHAFPNMETIAEIDAYNEVQ